MAMPSELNPLLPQTEPAPEIQGHRTKRRQNIEDDENKKDSGGDIDSPSLTASSFRTIMFIFIFVVALGLLTSYGFSDGFHRRASTRPLVPHTNITARVDKILSENPLFGTIVSLPFDREKGAEAS